MSEIVTEILRIRWVNDPSLDPWLSELVSERPRWSPCVWRAYLLAQAKTDYTNQKLFLTAAALMEEINYLPITEEICQQPQQQKENTKRRH